MNPLIGMLHNTATNRYHPIYFFESPLPGGGGPIRYKSKGHHTTGYATREEALVDIPKLNEELTKLYGPVKQLLETDFIWDGTGIPAIVHFEER